MNTVQRLLIVSTIGSSLRSDIQGWSEEFGDVDREMVLNNPRIEVGKLLSSRPNLLPKTIAHALRQSWKLLAPPVSYKEIIIKGGEKQEITMYEWWLSQEVPID